MHPETIFRQPIFIPKLIHIDTQFPELFKDARAFLVPANFFTDPRYKRFCTNAIENCDICVIDPVTNAFTYDGFLEKPTYRALPYAPNDVLLALDLRSNSKSRKEFVRSVIDFQVENEAGLIIVPYLFARDIDDARFMLNLDLISDALRYIDKSKIALPLFAMLNIGSSCLDTPRITDMVIEQYVHFGVQGFFVCVENFDDRVVGYEQLIGLAQLCRRLSARHDIVMSTIASFGQVLCSLGINAFVGGVGWLETFHEINLRSGRVGFAGQQIPRAQYYYVPEIFSYIRPDDMMAIFNSQECPSMVPFHCKCQICSKELPTDPIDKKTHFLIRRFEEMRNLSDIEASKRPEHIRERIELALALAEDIENEVLIRISTEHLVRWLNVLDSLLASPPSPTREKSEDLDKLIHQIRLEK